MDTLGDSSRRIAFMVKTWIEIISDPLYVWTRRETRREKGKSNNACNCLFVKLAALAERCPAVPLLSLLQIQCYTGNGTANLFLQSATLDLNWLQLYSRFRMCPTTQNAPAAFKQIIFACGTSVTKLLVPDKRSHLSVHCLRAAMKKGKPSLKFTRTDMLQLHIAQTILGRMEIEKKAAALSL